MAARIIVTDGGLPPLSTGQSFTVTVLESNSPPVLQSITNTTIYEGQLLVLTNHAADADWPAQRLTFRLDTNAPTGAAIDPINGIFTWQPSEMQGPGTNLINVIVMDDGSPPMTSAQSFTITVLESNRPPALEPIADITISEAQLLSRTNSATDMDWPSQRLTCSDRRCHRSNKRRLHVAAFRSTRPGHKPYNHNRYR